MKPTDAELEEDYKNYTVDTSAYDHDPIAIMVGCMLALFVVISIGAVLTKIFCVVH